LQAGSLHWIPQSHIGITASTGQLVDSHDVLALQSFSEEYALEEYNVGKMTDGEKFFAGSDELNIIDRIVKIEHAVIDIMDHLQGLDHMIEHSLITVGSSFESLHDKIENTASVDNINSNRYESDDHYGGHVPQAALPQADHVARHQVEHLTNRLNDVISKTKPVDNWRLPFMILVVIVLIGAIGFYMFYRRLLKTHLL
jgi:hypothetical protein